MEFKGTKGKWVFDQEDVSAVDCPKDGGDIICEAPLSWEDSMKRWEANALLISKAPEMLEMLQILSNHFGLFPDDRDSIKNLIKSATEI